MSRNAIFWGERCITFLYDSCKEDKRTDTKFDHFRCERIKRRFMMSTITVECSSCGRKFKTLYSLNKHRRDRHEGLDGDFTFVPVFKNDKGIKVSLPKPAEVSKDHHATYIMWLAGLVERINSTFHPRLPGKYM